MSANLEKLRKEGDKRIRQLEYIKEKFGTLARNDIVVYAPVDYIAEADRDIARIRSTLSVADTVYDRSGQLDDVKTERFLRFFRAIVVYREFVYEIRRLLDDPFGMNLFYRYLNPAGTKDKEAEIEYLTENPQLVNSYIKNQRDYIKSTNNYRYVKIDETVPFGL